MPKLISCCETLDKCWPRIGFSFLLLCTDGKTIQILISSKIISIQVKYVKYLKLKELLWSAAPFIELYHCCMRLSYQTPLSTHLHKMSQLYVSVNWLNICIEHKMSKHVWLKTYFVTIYICIKCPLSQCSCKYMVTSGVCMCGEDESLCRF